MSELDLMELASQARKQAYAPYSNYKVGAALLSKNGEVYTGCNVENASYGLSMCAERSAVFAAVSAGANKFTQIAISLREGGSPCGACRQVLSEFAPDLEIIIADENGNFMEQRALCELLPEAFGPGNLS